MTGTDVRWQPWLDDDLRALAQLRSAAGLAERRHLSERENRALIQAFELTRHSCDE